MSGLKALARKIAPATRPFSFRGRAERERKLFARYIHQQSGRKDKPFIALNCAALPETLLESELFGYEKGAFTGAIRNREGKFELAHTGTLLLDEVNEIPLHLQAKLLRVLQEGEVDRLGGKYPVPVDVRVIATTNIRIDEHVKEGKFRKDLYYRLNVIPLRIPPLCERPGIRCPGAVLFAKVQLGKPKGRGRVHPEASGSSESIPGREMSASCKMSCSARCLYAIPGPGCREHNPRPGESCAPRRRTHADPLSELEKMMIQKALSVHDGNRTRAAETLGISVRTLRNKLHEYRQSLGM